MATYLELRNLYTDGELKNRLDVAITIEAYALVTASTPSAEKLAWASRALASPRPEAEKALRFVLAAHAVHRLLAAHPKRGGGKRSPEAPSEDQTVAAITGASDAVLQAQTALLVPALVAAS